MHATTRPRPARLLSLALALVGLVTPALAEELAGELAIGENLEIYLMPQPGFFQRVLGSIGLSSPPQPISLVDAAARGRDRVVVAQTEDDWSIFAKVRPAEGEEFWYDIGKPSTKFWQIHLKDGVVISRVKKDAVQIFEGSVDGDPWFLRVDAPSKLRMEEEITPQLVGIKFWLDEYIFNYDEISHSTRSGKARTDNYSVLRDALVTGLPDELDVGSDDPEPFERFKQLAVYVGRARSDELVPLRDLLEAKVERLREAPVEDPKAREEARKQYTELLEGLRKRTTDE